MPPPPSRSKNGLSLAHAAVVGARALGSLRLALTLLPLFAAVLFLGTLVESWYERQVAVELVYGTWWFALLLASLGVNVLFAAAKKWPWRRHQTGFLITHLGLITLVSGGLISSLTGITGEVKLVDADDARAATFGPRTGSEVIDARAHVLRVARPQRGAAAFFESPLATGPSAWQPASNALPLDGLTRCLIWLAHPMPRHWRRELDAVTALEVLDFQPHTRPQPFSVAAEGEANVFPAAELELSSSLTGPLPKRWLAATAGAEKLRFGPGLIEWRGTGLSPAALADFLAAKQWPRTERGLLGLLQLATDLEGRLYFRSFSAADENQPELARDRSGACPASESLLPIWPAMNWRFRVTQFFPAAVNEANFLPVARVLGQEDGTTLPALRVRLSHDGAAREFWVGLAQGEYVPVTVGGEEFWVGWHARSFQLPFSLTLERAEQTTDRGSKMAATQTSYVQLMDSEPGGAQESHTITLNSPLGYRGYRVYQAGFETLGGAKAGKPLNRSTLRVTLDPGLRLKYVGSLLVAGGIACMFYMRAYGRGASR